MPIDKQSEKWWSYNSHRDNSIVTNLFTGQLMNKIECKSCKYQSLTFDNFMDLSVAFPRSSTKIKGYVNLEECLNNYIMKEKMEQNGYKCQKCDVMDNCTKELTIYRFPKIMVIHLKRFYNSTMRREKLNTSVIIPLTVDLK